MAIKLPEVITEEELIKIVDATKNKQHKLAFMLGFYECMRISEIVALLPEHIDYQMKLIMIKQAKGSKDRNIPIAPEVLKGLKHLPIGIGIRALQIAFKRKCKALLNREALHFHSLRASGITHYLTKKRWSSLEVQRMAGHSKISTTQIYTNINPSDLVNRMWEQGDLLRR
jgi:integrase/recombinase XerD